MLSTLCAAMGGYVVKFRFPEREAITSPVLILLIVPGSLAVRADHQLLWPLGMSNTYQA
ncbi:MAG: hypothetical protein R3C45_12200 [Phycisphaerales bacterium]